MVHRRQINTYLNQLLSPDLFRDYCPNGLQISGRDEINRIVSGVTASQALIDAAIAWQADAIIVHHGLFWKGDDPCLTGIKYQRIKALIQHEVNLWAYHLPLDAHATLGNNVLLAKQLGWHFDNIVKMPDAPDLLCRGSLAQPLSPAALSEQIALGLGRDPLHISVGTEAITQIAWCTGAAQDFIEAAHQAGAQAYISGEISERTVHTAQELGIHYYAAGHHATERYGVAALGQQLAEQFSLAHQFIDIANPV